MNNFKKYLPFVLAALLVIAVIMLVFMGENGNKNKTLDERVTFRNRDKIPYGTYVAYNDLKYLFPQASISIGNQAPGYWDSLSMYDKNQAVIIVCPEFSADKAEMKNLVSFANAGNDVFISTFDLSYDVEQMLNCNINSNVQSYYFFGAGAIPDTMTVYLSNPPFAKQPKYVYPGRQLEAYFSSIDTTISTVIGYDHSFHPDFIHLKAGSGNIYVQLTPMAFTNYFLLYKNNREYYEKALSLISPEATKVVWDEYYLYKKNENRRPNRNWLTVLLNTENSAGKKPFKAAFWLLLSLLALYTLLEMRRKQRYIKVVKKPNNDSLDFVKTIGRLYHDKGDHRNLCKKMSAYFLEHVRSRYKLPTTLLNEEFIKYLHFKSGVEEEEIRNIVSFIRDLDQSRQVSDKQLIAFHNQLESFYKKE